MITAATGLSSGSTYFNFNLIEDFKTKEGIAKGEIATLWVSGKLNSDVMTKGEVTEILGAMLAAARISQICQTQRTLVRQGVMRLETKGGPRSSARGACWLRRR